MNNRKKYKFYSMGIIFLFALVLSIAYLMATHEIENTFKIQTEDTIMNLKKVYLKDHVENQILRIEDRRNAELNLIQKSANSLARVFKYQYEASPDRFLEVFTNTFAADKTLSNWIAVVYDVQEDKLLLDTKELHSNHTWDEIIAYAKSDMAVYQIDNFGTLRVLFGLSHDQIDENTKKLIHDEIHASKFSDDAYIWVNEILSYEGGADYAIRKIHPNIPETEGMFLSTEMTDIVGNYPYLEELEGINQEGELYYTYYFKRLGSDEVSEKLAYAKLYKRFNWVVSMGIHLDDIQSYAEVAENNTSEKANRMIIVFIIFVLPFILIGFFLIVRLERALFAESKQVLIDEINTDMLTKAYSRKAGINDLEMAFEDFKKNGVTPVIASFDIDHFKATNDLNGHDVGDDVLIIISKTVMALIRNSDRLYRWGGDEFLIIFNGLQTNMASTVVEKVRNAVYELEFSHLKGPKPTLSIGVSHFEKADEDYLEAIKRADQALYESKKNGKNKTTYQLKKELE